MASVDRAGQDGPEEHGQPCGHDETVTLNGYKIPRLQVRQVIQLCRDIDTRRRKQLICQLDDAGADAATRLKELKSLERYENQTVELARYALSLEGACDIIERALSLMDNGPKLDDLNIRQISLLQLACDLINFDFDELTRPAEGPDPTLSQSPSAGTG